MKILFNINELVRVKLTPLGREILASEARQFRRAHPQVKNPYTPPKEDAEGWSNWILWRLMAQFGPHIGAGQQPPFETAIEIIGEQP